jgi:2-polyprenyl-3-methyl-5-hydroxy-6-metoxy-1,4-benzoquinol methylase
MSERFDEHYWRDASHYRRFEDYRAGLEATAKWYEGLLRLVDRFLPGSGRHLDVGCGHGALVHMLQRRGYTSYGVDASEWVIAEAKRFAPDLADRFAVADIEQPLSYEQSFDLVTSLEVVEHVRDPGRAIERMAASLVPGGTLLLSTPNPNNRVPGNNPTTSDPTHISLHPPAWWRAAVEAAGLRVVHDGTFIPVPLVWRVSASLARWVPLGPSIGPGYLCVAHSAGP